MGLFEPIWKTRMFHTDKEKKAIAYVRNLSDPEKLAVIALEAPSLNVRRAAVEGIVDEKLLLDVALKTDSCFVAEAVTAKLHDSGLLQELALRGTDSIPFEKLVKKRFRKMLSLQRSAIVQLLSRHRRPPFENCRIPLCSLTLFPQRIRRSGMPPRKDSRLCGMETGTE